MAFGISYIVAPDQLTKNFVTNSSGHEDSRYLLRLCGVSSLSLGASVYTLACGRSNRSTQTSAHKVLAFASFGVGACILTHNVLKDFWKWVFLGTNVVRTLLHLYFGFW